MRLGIFGGTFNPIHIGHLVLAECARAQARLDHVWFIPTAIPPHKPAPDVAPAEARLSMVRSAIRGHPAFRVHDMELRRGGISYTLETLRMIRTRHPRATLFLIVGSDMLQVPWYGLKEIARECTFLVAPRHPAISHRRGVRVMTLAMPQIEISSSMIRERLRAGQSIRYLVPETVEREIRRHRLYARPSHMSHVKL